MVASFDTGAAQGRFYYIWLLLNYFKQKVQEWSAAMLFRNKLYCVITLVSIIPPFLQQNRLLNHVQRNEEWTI